jgi:hypothetical protein
VTEPDNVSSRYCNGLARDGDEPWPAPASDPTNPYRDETVGEFTAALRANERRVAEPGLTDRDREERL